ncbi:MAG: hypothetical protein MPN21_25415 [Thermoanaerobaculia bacterium]|nr:hypothetical protein [Thermoanaerobaculia bacterium]
MDRLRKGLAPLLALFAALGAWRSLASPDTFWHLAAGRWILDHGEVPDHDPFRFTSDREPWVDHEWGFQLLLALAERIGGLTGVLAFRCAIFVLLAWLLWRLGIRIAGFEGEPRGDGMVIALGFGLLVTLDGLHGRMPLRPELLTLVLFATLLWLLEVARERPNAAWLTLPLTALWVNVHPGALLAPGVVFLHLAGRRLQPGALDASGIRPSWATAMGFTGGTALALGANPWGFHVVALPLRIRAALSDLPATNPDWRRGWDDPPYWLLGILLLLTFTAIRLRDRRVDLASAFELAAMTALTCIAVRFQGLAWIAAFAFAAHLVRLVSARAEVFGRRIAPVTAALLLLACGVEGWRASQAPAAIAPGRFPEAGMAALATWDREVGVGHLFHHAVFGGYVLYRSFPPRQVFVDTRNEVDPSILHQIAEARSDARAWRALVERYELDAALLRYEDRPRQVLGQPAVPGGRPTMELRTTSALLFPPDRWALVHWDDVSMLFLRRTEARAARLADSEYRFVQPEDVQTTLQKAARDPAFRAGLTADLQRKIAEDPDCRRARAILDALQRRLNIDTIPSLPLP